MKTTKTILYSIAALLLFAGCSGQTAQPASPTSSQAVESAAVSEDTANTEASNTTASTDADKVAEIAKKYVDKLNYSKQKLLYQLTAEKGERLPEDVAKAGVEKLNVDWKEVALRKATEYKEKRKTATDMIKKYLVEADQFSEEEAQYAVDHLK